MSRPQLNRESLSIMCHAQRCLFLPYLDHEEQANLQPNAHVLSYLNYNPSRYISGPTFFAPFIMGSLFSGQVLPTCLHNAT